MRRWPALIVFILLSLPQGVAAQDVVNLASIEHPPYTGEQLKHDGMITQIIQEAYARVGYQVGICYYSAAKAAIKTEAGVNGSNAASASTNERSSSVQAPLASKPR